MNINQTSHIAAAVAGLVLWFLSAQPAHCFYNPSTGRWLNRDPLGERHRHTYDLYSFAINRPIAAIDKDGRITVQLAVPTKSPCGNYSIFWTFLLDQPAPCDGYLVQKVTIRDKYAICGSPPTQHVTIFGRHGRCRREAGRLPQLVPGLMALHIQTATSTSAQPTRGAII